MSTFLAVVTIWISLCVLGWLMPVKTMADDKEDSDIDFPGGEG